MRLLLDTNAWLYLTTAPSRLSVGASREIGDARSEVYLSVASAWEMAIKVGLGKLRLPEPVVSYQLSRMARHRVKSLPVEVVHAAQVSELPHPHRDPFDRLLVSQAGIEGLTLVTSDRVLAAYGVPLRMM